MHARLSHTALLMLLVWIIIGAGLVFLGHVSLREALIQREKEAVTQTAALIVAEIESHEFETNSARIALAQQRAELADVEIMVAENQQSAPPAGTIVNRNGRLLLTAQGNDGSMSMVFSRSLDSANALVGRVTTGLAVILALFTIPVTVVGYQILRGLTRRVTTLQNAAHRFARGELDYRIAVSSPAELAGLAATLNGMADQLHQRLETARNQRRESEVILASMVEGILVLETSLKIRTLNDVAATLLGTRIDRARGQYLHELPGTEELASFARESVRRQEPTERTVVMDSGEAQYFQVHSSPLEEEAGRARGLLLVLNDITRIKRLEDMRRDFVANVSHELKTPVTSIKGFVETLLDEDIEDQNQRDRFLRIVLRHSSRLQTILEDLLSLSRLEQADHTIPRDTVNLHTLTDRIEDAVGYQAQEKGMRLTARISGDPVVVVNVNLIEQAVVNLVDNAVKYGKESTDIQLHFSHHAGQLTIEVTNQGPAIPKESLPRLFERFYRVDKARSRSFGGTGLGLAIVKHIAMAHGGTVRVRSEEKSGTTFRMQIPAHSEASEATEAPATS